MNAIKFILISFVVCLQFSGSGQTLDMHFNAPFKNQDFARSNVTCIAQDSTGFIWIGTENGLYKYDGNRLHNYQNNIEDSTSLVNENIKKLFVDDKGNLWVATIFGICIYEKTYDRFKQIAYEKNYAGLESLHVLSITQDKNGQIYVSSGNKIYLYNEESGLFSIFYQIESGIINEFLFDHQSNLWIASDRHGLTVFNFTKNKSEHFLSDEKNSGTISNNHVADIVLHENKLWIGTYGAGVNSLDLNSRKIKRYSSPDPYATYTLETYVDKKGNLWICDLTGLKLYDKQNDSFFGYYGDENDKTSLKSAVVCFFQDRQGNYWVGYNPGGVDVRMVSKGFQKIDKKQDQYWHTSDNNITAIEFDRVENWWLGNGFNGIDIFDWQNGQIKTYHYEPNNPHSLGKGGVACIFRDRRNTMWIGTNFGGLQYYHPEEDRFYSFTNQPNNNKSIANNDVRSIVDDKNGNIWLAVHGKGIDRFDQNKGIFYHYTQSDNHLSNDWVFQLLIDSEDNLWAATAWGVSKLPKGADTFENYIYVPNDSNTINSNLVNCIFEDSKNIIWVGTKRGLSKYHAETDNFEQFHSESLEVSIHAIQEDQKGNLWISTNSGLTRFNPETRKILNFDMSDGLLAAAYNSRSVAKTSDKRLFFGGMDGLTVFDPQALVFNDEIPNVIVTAFTLFNKPVTNYGEEEILKKHISETRQIELNYDQNTIGFEFVATNFINAEKNRFKYQLKGVDKDWIDVRGENVANYAQLKPGKYTFRVIASNNDNVWNEEGVSIDVVIRPPWWLTPWFRVIVLFSVLLLFYLVMRQRMATLIRQKKELEKKVLERTNVLSEKNELLEKRQLIIEQQSEELRQQAEELLVTSENIEEKNTELTQINATKDKLFSIIAHDLLNPFNVILGFTDVLIENFDTWNEAQKLEILNYIKDSSGNAFNLLENLLHWSRSQKGMIEFSPVFTDINQSINSVLDDVASFAIKKEVKIINLFEGETLNVYADENMLKLIGRNLLMNAIKFSNPSGKIFIEVEPDYQSSFIRFSVRDEGVGMKKSKAENLFKAENNSSTRGTKGEKGVGLGLVLCHDFVQLHKGKIWAESEENKGTTVFFTIPKFTPEA